MSIFVNLARVSETALEAIRKEPTLLEALFFETGDAERLAALGLGSERVTGFDYRTLHEALLGLAEAMGEEVDEDQVVFDELAVGGEIDFDAGMGPAFFTPAKDVASVREGMLSDLDAEVKAVLDAAFADGDCLVGVIS
ncbi:MAG: DUF1877 family protein [Myxococcota bacterium]